MLCVECFFLEVTMEIIMMRVIYVNPYSIALGKDAYANFKYHFEGHSNVVTIIFY